VIPEQLLQPSGCVLKPNGSSVARGVCTGYFAKTACGTTTRVAIWGSNFSSPMRASPMSGLLSAMMSSSDGTQFRLDFLVFQVDDRDLQPAKLVGKPEAVPTGKFRRLP
jgi:hypothetical protein